MSKVQLMKTPAFEGGGNSCHQWQETPAMMALRAKTGLRILMAVISSLFFLFIVSFLIRSQIADWEHLSAPWRPLANPWPLWVNTGSLILASIFLQWSKVSAGKGQARPAIDALVLAGIFSLVFIGGQLKVWQQLMALGYYVSTNPANSFFYLLTGLHALHLAAGLAAWCKTVMRAWHGVSVEQLSSSIELCAMYWHYLLALWFVLLALLTSSPETYAALARLCGL